MAWRWGPSCGPASTTEGDVTEAATSACCNTPKEVSVGGPCCPVYFEDGASLREYHENKESSNDNGAKYNPRANQFLSDASNL